MGVGGRWCIYNVETDVKISLVGKGPIESLTIDKTNEVSDHSVMTDVM